MTTDTTAGIAITKIQWDATQKRGPSRMRFGPPLAFTVPWVGDVPIKGQHDEFVDEQIRAYALSLTGKAAISFEWEVVAV